MISNPVNSGDTTNVNGKNGIYNNGQVLESNVITKRAYARVGLIGNPSDGFNGKTISLSISNFWADVRIFESEKIKIIPHPLHDLTEFEDLESFLKTSKQFKYSGGLRLLQAALSTFYQYCRQKKIMLTDRKFTISYETNIPRQVGLAGSSAIVTACLKCLMEFFKLTHKDIPKEILPQIILDAEKVELNMNAGLQDRVVQVYEGVVYMDFNKDILLAQGHGKYEQLHLDTLPPLWLAYADSSDSSVIHNDVNVRWKNGDKIVSDGMMEIAKLADDAKVALLKKDWPTLHDLMNKNFLLRRQLYGKTAIDEKTLRMAEIARKFGCCVKLPGSGGAVLGIVLENDTENMVNMRKQLESEGFTYVDIVPNV